MTEQPTLHQCPYCPATKCSMDEPCDGCETKAISLGECGCYCTQCNNWISETSLPVNTDANGNRVCSEGCQDEANFDIGRDMKEGEG